MNDLISQAAIASAPLPALDWLIFESAKVAQHRLADSYALLGVAIALVFSLLFWQIQTRKPLIHPVKKTSKRQTVAAKLAKSPEFYQTLLESCPTPIWQAGLDGQYHYFNPAWLSFTGRTLEQEIGDGWIEGVHPDDRELCCNIYLQALETRQPFVREYRLRHHDGEYRWMIDRGKPFNDSKDRFAGYIGSCYDMTESKQLEVLLRQQAQREQWLRASVLRIRQSFDLEEILATAVNEVRQMLQADRALIFQLNLDGSGVVIQESVVPEYPVTLEMCWLDECFLTRCYEYYRQGRPRIVLDVATDGWAACIADFMQRVGVKSKIVAPIIQNAQDASPRVWGLLIVHACSHCRQWQPDEAELLQQISNQLAIAIQQVNLYHQLHKELTRRKQAESARQQVINRARRSTQRERFIATITQHVRQSLDLAQILMTTVEEVRQFLQVDRVAIFRFNPDCSGKIIAESLSDGVLSISNREICDPCFNASMINSYSQGRIHVVDDILTAELHPCYVELLTQLQVRAILAIPIVVGQDLWGLLVAHHCQEPCQWQRVNWQLLQQLSIQLAIGIHQAELYQQTQQQAQKEQALNRLIQTIRNSLDLETVFATATAEIAQLLQADRALIVQHLSEQKLWRNVADYRQTPNAPSTLGVEIPDEGNTLAESFKQLAVICIDDDCHWEEQANPTLIQSLPGTWLPIPLHIGCRIWGSLVLMRNRQQSWQNSEVELMMAVADQLAIAIHQSELYQQVQAANQELQRLATLDGLTQIANRRRFDEYFNCEWRRHAREQASLSLILLDIDYFKRYNDTFGHPAGDECLRQIASTLSNIVRRPADLVARYGGEEFAAILPHTETEGAIVVGQSIQQAIRNLAIPHPQSSASEFVTVSLGIASIVPTPELSPQDLINAADQALYTAKQQGRDRYWLIGDW